MIRGTRRERIIAVARAGALIWTLTQAHLARAIEYDVSDQDCNDTGELIVLLTTIVDPPRPGQMTRRRLP